MIAPAWVTWLVTVLVILLALGSGARLVVPRLRRQHAAADVDIMHALMGVAMAGMLMPRLSVLPGDPWLAVFAVGTAWFGWQAMRPRWRGLAGAQRRRPEVVPGQAAAEDMQVDAVHAHPVPHAVECLAMIYMLVAVGSLGPARQHGMAMPGMAASTAAGLAGTSPLLALLLCVFMLGSALWTIDKLTASSPKRAAPRDQGAKPPRLASYSKIGMSLAMGYALLTML
jgi:hypothetical protein